MKTILVLIAAAFGAAGAAHAAVSFEDLYAADSIRTDLVFTNASRAANRCTLELSRTDGRLLAPALSLTLRPREERLFRDLFERLVEPSEGVVAARATVACARPFSAHAERVDLATGEATRLVPSPRARAEAPATAATLPVCSAAADCFDSPGLFFTASPGQPVGRIVFPAPIGQATRFKLALDVKVDDWFQLEPDGKHLIYWFVVDRNFFMPGLLYFRGPSKNEAFARHGMALTHPQKIKIIKPFAAEVGHTYRIEQDYDMKRGVLKITIKDLAPGGAKQTLRGKPNVTSYSLKAGSKFIVDVGFPLGVVATEVPSYDWEFSNLHIEAFVQ